MTRLGGHLLLALSVLVGSAIPFVPTGEMVSGAAAYATHSELKDVLIFAITWICSVLGDGLLLLEARLGARLLRPWLAKRSLAGRVEAAQQAVQRNAVNAIVTGRLIPGGRTPVIVALGLGRFPLRRFLAIDLLACALWAGIYASLGAIGGRIAHHPVWAMVVAIAFAVSVGALVQQLRRLWEWRRRSLAAVEPAPETDPARPPEGDRAGSA